MKLKYEKNWKKTRYRLLKNRFDKQKLFKKEKKMEKKMDKHIYSKKMSCGWNTCDLLTWVLYGLRKN